MGSRKKCSIAARCSKKTPRVKATNSATKKSSKPRKTQASQGGALVQFRRDQCSLATENLTNGKGASRGVAGASAGWAGKNVSTIPSRVLKVSKGGGTSRLLAPKSEILRQAAYAVSRMIQADATGKHGTSLKSLTLGGNVHVKQKRAVYAVTVETLKYYTVLEALVQGVGGLESLSVPTACVLVKEVILGSGFSKQWVGPAERLVLAKEDALKAVLDRMKEERGVDEVSGLLAQNALMAAAKNRKRTLRVNTPLVAGSVEEVVEELEEMVGVGGVVRNVHIEDVLELEPGVDLHAHRMVKDGSIVLQSLASCMPAAALDPEVGWTVIDACAAPGNKTTHLASLMARKANARVKQGGNNRGKVYAFDRDPKRLARLEANVALTNSGSIIKARCADFLTVDPKSLEYQNVDAVLLDPSCSGSGTSVSRMDYLLPSAQEAADRGVNYTDDRVEQLSRFQLSAIIHAMSFPRVKKLVYSTCSVYCEENERVVARAMDEGRKRGFELVSCIPSWPRRGIVETDAKDALPVEDAEKVLRIDPLVDGTDGFFVASWQRIEMELE